MRPNIKVLDVVALTQELSDAGLVRGQVGTVVEHLGPDTFEVEFCDSSGHTDATRALKADQLVVLHHEPPKSA